MLKIVTFNLRCLWDGDGINSFIHRVGLIYEKINSEKPDLIAFQEMTDKHLAVLERLMTEYEFIGGARNTDYGGEGVYTAIRKESMKLIGFDFFWLSPTPYIPGTRFEEQSPCPRICASLKMLHIKSGKTFRFINTHLDHIPNEAIRIVEMKQLMEYIIDKNAQDWMPTLLVGDFNALPSEPAVGLCTEYMKDVTNNISVTFHDFGRAEMKIDYVFVSEELEKAVVRVEAWKDERNGIYLSDHYPICVELDIKK